jgi:hypothetical protein
MQQRQEKQQITQDHFNPTLSRPNEKGEWICGDCQIEELHKRKIRVLGEKHPDSKFIIELEDKNVRAYNNYAKRCNENMGAGLKYRKNRYTGKTPL